VAAVIHAAFVRSDQLPQRVARIEVGMGTASGALAVAYKCTQSREDGCWSMPNAQYRSQWGRDNVNTSRPLKNTECMGEGEEKPWEDVVSVLVPLPNDPEGRVSKLGLRSTTVGDYFVVESTMQGVKPVYVRAASCGFDVIKESDLSTPDPLSAGMYQARPPGRHEHTQSCYFFAVEALRFRFRVLH
jgi:hypothetical protein